MNQEGARRGLLTRGCELQEEINDLAAEYFEEMRRQDAQKDRFARMAEKLVELRKIQQLAQSLGCTVPDLLTSDAEDVRFSVALNTTLFRGDATPPADSSGN